MTGIGMAGDRLTDSEWKQARRLITTALEEDLHGKFDLTTEALIPADAHGTIRVVSRAEGVLAGNPIAAEVFNSLDTNVSYQQSLEDGARIQPGSVIAEVSGSMKSLLVGERTALNFLTMLSGIATLTRRFVDAVGSSSAKVLDTRKTLPGLRDLQKYAVRCGGGTNHRMGLFDAVLIKDNHLAWWQSGGLQSVADAVVQSRKTAPAGTVIEIEVDSVQQLRDVLPANPDIVLLDNMSCDELAAAKTIRDELAPDVLLEASGGVNLQTVPQIAMTGVDRISVGALTHSAVALDIGFDWGQSTTDHSLNA